MNDRIERVEGWSYNGYQCLAIKHAELGHWCGYVALAEDHPLHGMDYSHELFPDLVVHGGVTFTGWHKNVPDVGDDIFWVGFDCAHAGDRVPGLRIEHSPYETYKDLDYVRNECHRLVEQLKTIERDDHE